MAMMLFGLRQPRGPAPFRVVVDAGTRRVEHRRAGPRGRRLREAGDAGGGARSGRGAARARLRRGDDARARRLPDACASACGGRTRPSRTASSACTPTRRAIARGAAWRPGCWRATRPRSRRGARRAASTTTWQAMLAELKLLDASRRSASSARAVQAELVAATGAIDRGVRQYGYDVLAGVKRRRCSWRWAFSTIRSRARRCSDGRDAASHRGRRWPRRDRALRGCTARKSW